MISILQYLLAPYFKEPEPFKFKKYFSYIFKAYLLTILGIAVSGMLILLIDPYISRVVDTKSILADFRKADNNLFKAYGNFTFLIVCLIVPIVEESIFRLPLTLRKNAFAVSFGILFYRFSGTSFFKVSLTELATYLRLFGTILIYIISFKLIHDRLLLKFKENSFRILFWGSAFLFGIVHISNNNNINLLFLPLYIIYIIPQFILGLTLGAVRVNIGFWGAVILHSLVNFISFVL